MGRRSSSQANAHSPLLREGAVPRPPGDRPGGGESCGLSGGCGVDVGWERVAFLHFLWPSRTLVMKVTMAPAG